MPRETKLCPALTTNIPKLFQQQPQNKQKSCGIFSLCIIWLHEHYCIKRARDHSLRLSCTNYMAPGLRPPLGPFWCSDDPNTGIDLFRVSERAWRECHRESEQRFWSMMYGMEVCGLPGNRRLFANGKPAGTGRENCVRQSQTYPFWVEHWHERFPAQCCLTRTKIMPKSVLTTEK